MTETFELESNSRTSTEKGRNDRLSRCSGKGGGDDVKGLELLRLRWVRFRKCAWYSEASAGNRFRYMPVLEMCSKSMFRLQVLPVEDGRTSTIHSKWRSPSQRTLERSYVSNHVSACNSNDLRVVHREHRQQPASESVPLLPLCLGLCFADPPCEIMYLLGRHTANSYTINLPD